MKGVGHYEKNIGVRIEDWCIVGSSTCGLVSLIRNFGLGVCIATWKQLQLVVVERRSTWG